MMRLSAELAPTENPAAFARRTHDDSVLTHSNKREVFSCSFVANGFALVAAEGLKAEDRAVREVPKVSFT